MRAALHLARRFAGYLLLLAALAAAAWAALAPWLGTASPWSAAGPLCALAAWVTAVRTRELGEQVALAQTGRSPVLLAVPCAVLALAAQAALCALPSAPASPPAAEVRAVHGVGGDLLLRLPGGDVLWRGAGAPVRVPPRAGEMPAGFVPEPRSRARLSRRLLLQHPPLAPSGHPLDPRLRRWLYAAWTAGAVLWILGRERRGGSWLALTPFALLIW